MKMLMMTKNHLDFFKKLRQKKRWIMIMTKKKQMVKKN